jgi:hypothetical protein
MAGLFSTIFSNQPDDSGASAGKATAADDQGGGIEHTQESVAHAGQDISHAADVVGGVHTSFSVSIHAEASGSYQDADGTAHEFNRSLDLSTGETEVGQDLNLGSTFDHALDATGMSDSSYSAM